MLYTLPPSRDAKLPRNGTRFVELLLGSWSMIHEWYWAFLWSALSVPRPSATIPHPGSGQRFAP